MVPLCQASSRGRCACSVETCGPCDKHATPHRSFYPQQMFRVVCACTDARMSDLSPLTGACTLMPCRTVPCVQITSVYASNHEPPVFAVAIQRERHDFRPTHTVVGGVQSSVLWGSGCNRLYCIVATGALSGSPGGDRCTISCLENMPQDFCVELPQRCPWSMDIACFEPITVFW